MTVGRLGKETPEAFARNRLGDLWDDEPLMVLNDEGHHAYRPAPARKHERISASAKADREEATVWIDGRDTINAACGIELCVDLSATPFYIQGSGYPEGSPFPWIVSDFSLVDAIESGVTKIPRLPAIDSTGRPDPKSFRLWRHVTRDLQPGERLPGGGPKPEALYRKVEDALLALAGEWKEKFEQVRDAAPSQDRTPPVLIVVCDNTDLRRTDRRPPVRRHHARRRTRRAAATAATEPLPADRQYGERALQDGAAGPADRGEPPEFRRVPYG